MNLTKIKTLYDSDFALWIEATAKQLKSGDFSRIDLENLIEEVEALGKSQRKAVRSFWVRLLEHLLKRCYVPMPECYRVWEVEIRNFRRELKQELKDSPSLKIFISEIFRESYEDALQSLKEDYPNVNFPNICPFSDNLDELLNKKFWVLPNL